MHLLHLFHWTPLHCTFQEAIEERRKLKSDINWRGIYWKVAVILLLHYNAHLPIIANPQTSWYCYMFVNGSMCFVVSYFIIGQLTLISTCHSLWGLRFIVLLILSPLILAESTSTWVCGWPSFSNSFAFRTITPERIDSQMVTTGRELLLEKATYNWANMATYLSSNSSSWGQIKLVCTAFYCITN